MSGLTISGVSKTYGDTVALHPTDLIVEDGEFCCMLGSSGSGKSTLLRMIAGLESPDQGTVSIDGRDVTRVPIHKRRIGFVFQSYALFPHLSVEANVGFGLQAQRLSGAEIRTRSAEMLELVGLAGYESRAPKDLSGGQQQRVALARALVTRPEVLLLDEPLSALDKKIRGEMQRELKRIHRETGLTTIMVTHDQDEAMDLGDKVMLLDRGLVQQEGAPRELHDTPANAFVADFLGAESLGTGIVATTAGVTSVDVDGLSLATARRDLTDGDRVTVFIRPEAVEIGLPGAGAIEATVTSTDFFGPFARVGVSAGTADLGSVMFTEAATKLEVGQAVSVSVQPSGVHVFIA